MGAVIAHNHSENQGPTQNRRQQTGGNEKRGKAPVKYLTFGA
jgi:hypothetical protein